MIISHNNKPTLSEFSSLVDKATLCLNKDAQRNMDYFLTRNAQKLEDDVLKALNVSAKGTVFEDSIVKVSGQRFPDIVAGKYFGVEVKSSKDVNWITLGGSINESTRIEDVERIFLTFGKLVNPVEFRSRPYEECLSEVVVTHYPRYKIDMSLKSGETIFDKMNISYDELRKKENPVSDVIRYYKQNLKKGERLWWMEDHEEQSSERLDASSAKVRLWKTLEQNEKQKLIILGYAFFPEILGSNQDKYDNLSLWLVSKYGIVLTSMRDSFSAGGKVYITVNGISQQVSRSVYNLFDNFQQIKRQILIASNDTLKDVWNVSAVKHDRIKQWVELLVRRAPQYERIFLKLLDERCEIEL